MYFWYCTYDQLLFNYFFLILIFFKLNDATILLNIWTEYQPAFIESWSFRYLICHIPDKFVFPVVVKNISIFGPNNFQQISKVFVNFSLTIQSQSFTNVSLNNVFTDAAIFHRRFWGDENVDGFDIRFSVRVVRQTCPGSLVTFFGCGFEIQRIRMLFIWNL